MSRWRLTFRTAEQNEARLAAMTVGRSRLFRAMMLGALAPFGFLGSVGYVFCVVVFPYAMLRIGLAFTGGSVGVAWAVWVGLVVSFYTGLAIFIALPAVAELRSRVVNVATWAHVSMFACGYILAAFMIPRAIADMQLATM